MNQSSPLTHTKLSWCTQVPQGFSDWIKIIESTESKLSNLPFFSKYHVSRIDREIYIFAHHVIELLSNNNIEEAIEVYIDTTQENLSRIWN